MKKIAVLLTCYNRKEKTINCLKSFYKTIGNANDNIIFDTYLVDDNSTDGTSEAISMLFSNVTIIKGSGHLFWAKGMILAWETAISKNQDYDSFLLLNDDVILTENFLSDLLLTHEYCLRNNHLSGIYVCSTKDPNTSEISYGGKLVRKKTIFSRKNKVMPSDSPQPCLMSNANILLVTADVVKKIGIFDTNYIHSFADYDYTLTASKNGIPVLVCPGIGGFCVNDHGNNWLSSNVPLKERIKYLYNPKGLGYKQQIYYLKKHFKLQYPYYFTMLWLKTLFPFIWDKFKKQPN